MKRSVKRRRNFYQLKCRISVKKNTKLTGMAGSDKLDTGKKDSDQKMIERNGFLF